MSQSTSDERRVLTLLAQYANTVEATRERFWRELVRLGCEAMGTEFVAAVAGECREEREKQKP